jgi:hypothetical protein
MPSDLSQLFGSLRRDTMFARMATAEELRHIDARSRALRNAVATPGKQATPAPAPTTPSATTPSATAAPAACAAASFAGSATETSDDSMGGNHARIISVVNHGPAACTLSNPPKVQNKAVTFPPSPDSGASERVVVPVGKKVAFALVLQTAGAGAPPDGTCRAQTYRDLRVELDDGSSLPLPVTVDLPCQGAVADAWSLID